MLTEIKKPLKYLRNKYGALKEQMMYFYYTSIYTPHKVRRIRRQASITVLFIISEVGVWKTEILYLKMLANSRFKPVLLATPSTENPRAYDEVISFLKSRKYEYVELKEDESIKDRINPDIIFYQKPYDWVVPYKYCFRNNLYALFCYATYGFHSVIDEWANNQPLLNYSWHVYYENEDSASASHLMRNKGRNTYITGLPMMDELLESSSNSTIKTKSRKTIIWAPHHTIPQDDNWLNYSTFLDYYEFMLEIAHKYEKEVDFIFKPHPLLAPKLRQLWGDEKMEAYFEQWSSRNNCRVEMGKYIDVFSISSAMIHDCASFTIEYLYYNNPVMYLNNSYDHEVNMLDYAKKAYYLHYQGNNRDDIEGFIKMVIEGRDDMAESRKAYKTEYLCPPGNKTASDNIINVILGYNGCKC